jgi:hypothetical protein
MEPRTWTFSAEFPFQLQIPDCRPLLELLEVLVFESRLECEDLRPDSSHSRVSHLIKVMKKERKRKSQLNFLMGFAMKLNYNSLHINIK